jgi:crossover junction endodeoxyribonuclease RusA
MSLSKVLNNEYADKSHKDMIRRKGTPQTTLQVPWPITVNHYWGQRGKIKYITARGRAYREDIYALVLDAVMSHPKDEQLFADITYYPPDKRRRDLDNLKKCLLDSLEKAGVYTDDNLLKTVVYDLGDKMKGGGATVRLHTRAQVKITIDYIA